MGNACPCFAGIGPGATGRGGTTGVGGTPLPVASLAGADGVLGPGTRVMLRRPDGLWHAGTIYSATSDGEVGLTLDDGGRWAGPAGYVNLLPPQQMASPRQPRETEIREQVDSRAQGQAQASGDYTADGQTAHRQYQQFGGYGGPYESIPSGVGDYSDTYGKTTAMRGGEKATSSGYSRAAVAGSALAGAAGGLLLGGVIGAAIEGGGSKKDDMGGKGGEDEETAEGHGDEDHEGDEAYGEHDGDGDEAFSEPGVDEE
eukprot:TRINITY_DN27571_c0_g1_i1.p1 TRINITY_DN27571_c0_g1~~TRINITY_DN27571_c0_g1_i1.p1  ORF type:complete len:258 (+),score=54.58 TRINITY_DN27571_c0_g1_i1:139-912(+)